VLVGVATFLAREVKSLLVGEAAGEEITKALQELVDADPNVDQVLNVLTVQQGPGEVVVAMKLKMRSGSSPTSSSKRSTSSSEPSRPASPRSLVVHASPTTRIGSV